MTVQAARPHWALFLDWCTAAGVSALPATPSSVRAFLTELPTGRSTRMARLAAIRRAHAAAGLPDPYPARPVEVAPDPVLAEMLGAVTIRSWPAGVTGRRDGFLLMLYAGLHLTRPQIRTLRAADIASGVGWASVAGQPLARAEHPGACPVCALTRWIRVLGIAQRNGWWTVKREMAGQFPQRADAAEVHDCDRPVTGGWRTAELLLPAIDRYGYMDGDTPLSVRSISTVALRRRNLAEEPAAPELQQAEPDETRLDEITRGETTAASEAAPAAEPDREPWTRAATKAALAELDPLLDRIDAEIEAAIARAQGLFADPNNPDSNDTAD